MHFSKLTALGALAASVAAVPFTNHVVHEKRDAVPRSWVKRDRLDARAELPVRIGMTQRNLDRGHDMLMEV
jgi:tripeptidyl-peptidase-1